MLETLFWILLPLALLGDARMFLFIVNRAVFGSHREEEPPAKFLLWLLPLVLLSLTVLWWPLHAWLRWLVSQHVIDRITPEAVERFLWSVALAKLGALWLLGAAAVGLYWVIDRTRALLVGTPEIEGTRTLDSTVIPLRRAHIPFAWVRKLGGHNEVYDIEVTRHEVFIDDLAPELDGYRIAFLTDTHIAGFVRRQFYGEIVKQTMLSEPDLILLGGDFVTWERHIPLIGPALLEGLSARDGIYAVLGNHDYWANAAKVRAALEEHGVKLVINRSVVPRRGLTLLGIDEVYRGEPDLDAAFAHARDTIIGLSHHPDIIDELDGRRIDLLVCGHTHGGQIRFPFFGSVVVPSRHEGRYAAGFQRRGEVLMYVSRGIGAIPPLRILCKPEVATFVLRRGR